jgi:hypothetical protein
LLFLSIYWLTRSYVAALVVAGAVALGSIWSNVRFFRTVGEQGRPGGDIAVFRAQPQTLQQDLENAFGRGAG